MAATKLDLKELGNSAPDSEVVARAVRPVPATRRHVARCARSRPTAPPVPVMHLTESSLLRVAVWELLEQSREFAVVAEPGSPAEARASLSCNPGIILVTAQLSPTVGGQFLRHLGDAVPQAAVILVCDRVGVPEISWCALENVRSCLVTASARERLLQACRDVAAGGTFWSVEVGRGLAAFLRQRRLTGREQTILQLMAAGRRNREIADELGIAVGTVARHVTGVIAKLGVRNRTQAVARAIYSGSICSVS